MSARHLALMALLVGVVLAGPVRAQSGGGYDLTWSTIDGGGGASSGGAYSLGGTVGQPDAGAMTGGAYTLVGGLWGGGAVPVAPGPQCIYLPLVLRSQ